MKPFDFPDAPGGGGAGWAGPERRRWPRGPGRAGLRCQVYDQAGAEHLALVANLSAGGARLVAPLEFRAGAPVPVLLYVPGHGLAFQTTARAVYAAPGADGRWFVGVAFGAPMPAERLRAFAAAGLGPDP